MNIQILAGRTYYLGASSAPVKIFVATVDGQRVSYVHTHRMGSNAATSVMDLGILRCLVERGCATRLASTRALSARYPYPWIAEEIAQLEAVLSGGDGGEESLSDYVSHVVTVRATEPPVGEYTRAEDPWYAAEQYGNVIGGEGWTYEIDGVNGATLRELRADAAFEVVEARTL
jgi:hypothetical protein